MTNTNNISGVKIVIIHGTYGSPDENWFPWLKNQLEMKGHIVLVPKLPTPEKQNLSNWKNHFFEQVGQLDEKTILIGHSLAVAFILRLLEESTNSIHSVFLVSGFIKQLNLPDFDPLNVSFLEKSFDWQIISANAKAFYVYHGNNDPYVPVSHALSIANNLKVKPVVIEGAGHINTANGYEKFELLLSDIWTAL